MISIFKDSNSTGGGGTSIASERNKTYRGKDLTNIYSMDDILSMVRSGTFDDLYLGDVISTGTDFSTGVRIYGFNLLNNHGNYNKITKPHILASSAETPVLVSDPNYYYDTAITTKTSKDLYNKGFYTYDYKYASKVDYKLTTGFDNNIYNTNGKIGSCNEVTSKECNGYISNEFCIFGAYCISSSKYYDVISLPKQLPIYEFELDAAILRQGINTISSINPEGLYNFYARAQDVYKNTYMTPMRGSGNIEHGGMAIQTLIVIS